MIGLTPMAWRVGVLAALISVLIAGHLYRVHHAYTVGHADAVAERAAADGVAIIARVKENAATALKQDATNVAITKAKNEEIATLRARLSAERMRKPAFCDGPSSTAQAESAGGGNVANPGSGLLPDRVAEDIQALILKTEEAAATGRACQRFIQDNGMAP